MQYSLLCVFIGFRTQRMSKPDPITKVPLSVCQLVYLYIGFYMDNVRDFLIDYVSNLSALDKKEELKKYIYIPLDFENMESQKVNIPRFSLKCIII